MSRARAIIAKTAATLGGAFTAENLHDRVSQHHPGIGLATVYRAVGAMTDSGYLARVGERDGAVLYAVCACQEHHHHAVCVSCGAVTPVACTIESAVLPRGFVITHHDVAVYGVCGGCAQDRQEACS